MYVRDLLHYNAASLAFRGYCMQFFITHQWGGTSLAEKDVVSIVVAEDALQYTICFSAAIGGSIHAPETPAGFTDGLWEYDVFEVFVLNADGTYLEIEVGPKNHWLAYWFASYRKRDAQRTFDPATFTYRATVEGMRWNGLFSFPKLWVKDGLAVTRWNFYQIRKIAEGIYEYLAWQSLPEVAPDYHRTECFVPLS